MSPGPAPTSSRICTVIPCEDYVHARDLCHRHYLRAKKQGVFLPLPTPAERLTSHLVRMPNGCLEWTGCTDDDGYGRIYANGKHVLVHRLAWELAHGPIPEGLEVCHHCDNPPCCDTNVCLFLGTHAENMADMKAKGYARGWDKDVTHCPDNHPYAGANLYVDPKGKRYCRKCRRAGDVRRYWRDRALAVAS